VKREKKGTSIEISIHTMETTVLQRYKNSNEKRGGGGLRGTIGTPQVNTKGDATSDGKREEIRYAEKPMKRS